MKKVGILAFTILIALSILGVGYALWTQNLTINGTAQTGELSAIFYESDASNQGSIGDYLNCATYSATGSGTGTLTIIVYNTYPGMQVFIPVKVYNDGTIPITNLGFVPGSQDIANLPTGSVFGQTTGFTTPLAVGDTTEGIISLYISNDADESSYNENYTGTYYSFSGTILASQ